MTITRKRALQLLNSPEVRQGRLSAALARAGRDRAINFGLLQKLVKGTLSWSERVADELSAAGWRADDRSSSVELDTLMRIAAYQVLFFEKVDIMLVIKETVQLAREARASTRDVTSMRKVIERLKAGKTSPKTSARLVGNASEIAKFYSHPEWVVRALITEIGRDETLAFCEANNRAWPVCVRVNSSRTSARELLAILRAEGVEARRGNFAEDSLTIERLPRGVRLSELESFRTGMFQVQDESATLVAHLVDPRPGQLVIDMCAAPGGKTVHMAQLMRNKGKVIAIDQSDARLKLVHQNIRRQGVKIVALVCGDAREFKPDSLAQRVLLDAPCSGLGVMGRKTDIRASKSDQTLKELVTLQAAMLDHAASFVAPGGKLVYSTCTVMREENEQQIERFLREYRNFAREVPQYRGVRSLVESDGYFRSWPHRHGIGGAFAAVLVRRR